MSHLGSFLVIGQNAAAQEHESSAVIDGRGEISLALAFVSGAERADVKERCGLNSNSLFVFKASPWQVRSQNCNKPLAGNLGEKQKKIKDRKAKKLHRATIGVGPSPVIIDARRKQQHENAKNESDNAIGHGGKADEPRRKVKRGEKERVEESV